MFVSQTYLSRECRYIDLPDREFFIACLDEAKERAHTPLASESDKDFVKRNTPIAHVSTLANRAGAEDICSRLTVHDEARAGRKFLMGDVDFDVGQEADSAELRQRLIDFADLHHTPLMLYPTMSYPAKPRFRFVLLARRTQHRIGYWRAMTWLYGELGMPATDETDFLITANRNLPVLVSQEQVDFCLSTFEDESLEPLDPTLWKGIEVPERIRRKSAPFTPVDASLHEMHFSDRYLRMAVDEYAQSKSAESYKSFWPFVRSVAASLACGGIDRDCAESMMRWVADVAPDDSTRLRWQRENVQLLDKQLASLRSTSDFERVKPLCSYSEFFVATQI